MLKNYFITAFRNIRRNKIFAVINMLGLSIGISAALVIFLIVQYEFSYDKFEADGNRIYRVVMNSKFNGVDGYSSAVPAPLTKAIQSESTGIELTVPVMQFQGDATAKITIAKESGKSFILKKQSGIIFTNPQYFYLLPYKWVAGSPKSSLQNPFNVVLTESRAQQYFPSLPATDIIGKQINYNDDLTATVSGIVKDMNEHTSFTASEFISYATIAQTHMQNDFMMNVWNDWMAYSHLYIKVSAGSNVANIESQLKTLLAKYNKDANKDAANTMQFHLQPLNDIHFNSLYTAFDQRIAHMPALYSLLAIAAFLLLLACINFINLTTANAAQRAKEIGIRKTMGSTKNQLVLQFLGETFLITFIATIISVCLTPLLLKLFADFIPPGLRFDLLHQPYIIVFLLLLTIVVSFASGVYPALILSGYNPTLVLKNRMFNVSNETKHAWIRKTLTVSQFVIAQFFVIATLLVAKQINYSINTDLGFNKEGIISFATSRDTVASHKQQLLNAINAIPEVEMVSRGFLSPAVEGAAFTNISYAPKPDVKAGIQVRWGDPDYLRLYNIKLLVGRNVSASDTLKELLINDNYAKLLGFNNLSDAIGKQLTLDGKNYPVVGVMQDFHQSSMQMPIMPLVFEGRTGDFFHIKLKPNNAAANTWQQGISKIQKAYKQVYPEEDFGYSFYDETIANLYKTEQQTASLLSWATGLTIFISCLGLLGLVMFTINTRTKEIGVRKILGASVANIITVLSSDFIKLVCIAFIIASPLAWLAINKWLDNYAYRTTISWWVFALAGGGMLMIALITLSAQTIKAAMANPVKSLRTE